MENFKRFFLRNANNRLIGAVAGLVISEESDQSTGSRSARNWVVVTAIWLQEADVLDCGARRFFVFEPVFGTN